MAEEKNDKTIEITFKLKDHLTKTNIGNAEIELYMKTDKSFSKKGTSSKNGIVKITIDEQDKTKKLYVKLLNSDDYYEYPFPNSRLPTHAVCYRRDRIQEVRFLTKRCNVGIVKAYKRQTGSIYSSESEYLSNWQDEILTIDKEQTITLKAFIVSNVSEEGIRVPNGRYFLNNSELEDEFSANIHWAFTIVDNIAGFQTVENHNSSKSADSNSTTNQTKTSNNKTANTTDNETNVSDNSNNTKIDNIADIDTSALARKIKGSSGEYLYPNQKQINNTQLIDNIKILDKQLDSNSLKQFKIYKLMKSGMDVIGHTINFNLSDVISDDLLNTKGFLDRFCIIFFAYIKENNQNSNNTDNNKIEVKYYSGKDNVQSIELKIVSNKYSIVFDGYNLELYENGKYMESYNARLTENGNLRNRDEFKFKQKDGIDDLFKCEAKLRSKVVDNMLHKVLYLKADNNNIISNFIVDNVMLSNLENQLKPKKDSDNNNHSDTQNNITSKVIHISSIDFKKLWHKIQFQSDILVKFIYQPKYLIEVTRYKEVYNSNKTSSSMAERYGATYGVFAVYVYYNSEKFLLDSVIDVYNSEYKDDKNKIIDTANLTREHITKINSFINIPEYHQSIKTDMYEKDLQNKATYGNLIYGGYTMEPAGPDCMTSNLKRRIPEGHYKGKFSKVNGVSHQVSHQNNTMRLYNDMVNQNRGILVHAGTNDIKYTTGCVLVSSQSYETGNEVLSSSTYTKDLLHNLYLFLYNIDIASKKNNANNSSKTNDNKPLEKGEDLSEYINVVIRNKFDEFGE